MYWVYHQPPAVEESQQVGVHERILLDCDMLHQLGHLDRFEVQELNVPAPLRDGLDGHVCPQQDPEL